MMESKSDKKILIYTRPWFEDYYSQIKKSLEEISDYEVQMFSDYSVKNTIDFRSKAIAFSENETLGETLDNDLLLDIILRDRLLRTLKKEDAYIRVKSYYNVLLDFFNKNDICLVFSATIDQYFIDLVYLLCLKKNIPFIGYHISIIPNHLLITARGERNLISKINDSDINKVVEILKLNNFKPNYIPKKVQYEKIFIIKYFTNVLRYLKFFTQNLFKINSYFNYHIECNVAIGRNLISRKYFTAYFFSFDKKNIYKEYIYIPLQFDPECNSEYWTREKKYSTYNSKIISFVESNPTFNFLLKEHPNMIALRDVNFYKSLKKLGCVIIHPSFDHKSLIVNSLAVATLNSSVGIEALCQNKPVLCLSKPYYASTGHIILDDSMKLDLEIIKEYATRDLSKSLNESIRIILESSVNYSIPDIWFKYDKNKMNFSPEIANLILNFLINYKITKPNIYNIYTINK